MQLLALCTETSIKIKKKTVEYACSRLQTNEMPIMGPKNLV